jgi:SulP family sulfate permease
MGSAVTGIYVSLRTSMPPAAAGPNNPAVAVMSVLAASVSGLVLANGGTAAMAVEHVLLSFTLATLVTGAVLYGLGKFRLGQYVRFVPYPVIGGFLAASGWLLASGGIKVVTGQNTDLLQGIGSLSPDTWLRLLAAAAFAAAVYVLKQVSGRQTALPIAFLMATAALDLALWSAGLRHEASGWYLQGTSPPATWVPLQSAASGGIDWHILLAVAPEIASAAGVTVVALLLDVSGLEVVRLKSADLDWEFRTNGAATILSAPVGGVMGKMSVNGTRLIDETGGTGRGSGLAAALIIGLVAVLGVDLARLVPAPILGGLLMYIGMTVLADVLLRSPAHRAWSDYALALLIMVAIVQNGYLAGVILGFVGACLMFALNYSRIAVIRRHLTRAVFASNVDRSAGAVRLLQDNGGRIHIFWLSGFIFFGSSHRLFEAISQAMDGVERGVRSYAVLDLGDVTGFDTSALLSLVKLRNHAEERGVTIAFAGLSEQMLQAFTRLDLIGPKRPHQTFATRNAALEWCEDELLTEARAELRSIDAETGIESWLATELGGLTLARKVACYFERRELCSGARLYTQGEPANSIDLIAEGSVAVMIGSEPGLAHLVRRMAKRTVVGEMGFFRHSPRAASVTAEAGAVVYTLTREAYDRLLAEEPEAGAAFLEFIVRALADRLEFANTGIAALS